MCTCLSRFFKRNSFLIFFFKKKEASRKTPIRSPLSCFSGTLSLISIFHPKLRCVSTCMYDRCPFFPYTQLCFSEKLRTIPITKSKLYLFISSLCLCTNCFLQNYHLHLETSSSSRILLCMLKQTSS